MTNVLLDDAVATFEAIICLAPVFLTPGYVIQRYTSVLRNTGEGTLDKIGSALVLSVGVLPILVYLLGRFSVTSTRVLFWATAAYSVVPLWRGRDRLRGLMTSGTARRWATILGIAAFIVIGLQIDWQWNNRVYASALAFDHALRIGIVGGLSRTEIIPPPDPMMLLGKGVPLAYHYFWFFLCSLPAREFPNAVGPRGAFMGGSFWAGLALLAAINVWLQANRSGREWSGTRWLVAGFVLLTSGLDVIPFMLIAGMNFLGRGSGWIPFPTLDWWSTDQITNWLDIALWVPHGAAALVACSVGLWLLVDESESILSKQRGATVIVAAACFASAVGTSIYVAFGFAAFCALYGLSLLVCNRRAALVLLGLAGVGAAILSAPFLLELASESSGQKFLQFGFRQPGRLLGRVSRSSAILYIPSILTTFALELGFFLAALYYWLRTRLHSRMTRQQWVLLGLVATTLLITSVLRSDAVGTNDLGMRSVMGAQFALAVIAADWLLDHTTQPNARSLWAALKSLPFPAMLLLVAGLLTTAAEVILLRSFTIFQEAGVVERSFLDGLDVGRTTAGIRSAYEWVQRNSPPDAVVQPNPSVEWEYTHGLYANRNAALLGTIQIRYKAKYATKIEDAIEEISPLFLGGYADLSPEGICSQWQIDYLFVKASDPVWTARNSWIWSRSPEYANETARVYACSPKSKLESGIVNLGQ